MDQTIRTRNDHSNTGTATLAASLEEGAEMVEHLTPVVEREREIVLGKTRHVAAAN